MCMPHVNTLKIMENVSKYLKAKSGKLKLCHNGPSECKKSYIFLNLIQNWFSQKKFNSTTP